MAISIIIPTLNEERHIVALLEYLPLDPDHDLICEILVVDGNSKDRTAEFATRSGAGVIRCEQRSRAVQMNLGAHHAKGDILYFLHADTRPPRGFAQRIRRAIEEKKFSGCFRLKFNWSHWFLTFNSWFTRFDFKAFRYGDQSLFVERRHFIKAGGFREDLALFEDQEIVARLMRKGSFSVLPDYVVTSARKYRLNGPYRLQLVYYWLYLLFTLGVSQHLLVKTYHNLIRQPMI